MVSGVQKYMNKTFFLLWGSEKKSDRFQIATFKSKRLLFWTLLFSLVWPLIFGTVEILWLLSARILYISRFRILKNKLYQGGMKSTVSWVFEDLKFKISEGYDQNCCFPDTAQLAVSAKLRQLTGQSQENTNLGPNLLKF